MAENFIETDEKQGENSKRRFNLMLWRHFHHWEHAQQAWILSLALGEWISSSWCWAASLTAKTWLTSWDMWEQQNCILSSINLTTMTEMMTFTANSRISLSGDKNFSKANLPTSFSIIGDTSSLFSLFIDHPVQWQWLLPENGECKKENGTWRVGPAAQNKICLQHRIGTGTRSLMGQWDGHGNWYEDHSKSNI
jgi:hypothetical protein